MDSPYLDRNKVGVRFRRRFVGTVYRFSTSRKRRPTGDRRRNVTLDHGYGRGSSARRIVVERQDRLAPPREPSDRYCLPRVVDTVHEP